MNMNLRDMLAIIGVWFICIGILVGYGWWNSLIVVGSILTLVAIIPFWRQHPK